MGAADHLIGVSTYDNEVAVDDLPRVGDYQTADWEMLAKLAPRAMIVQMAPQRIPPGFRQRADELHIALYVVKIDRLNDVYATIDQLGGILHEQTEARQFAAATRLGLGHVHQNIGAAKPVTALLVIGDASGGVSVAGPHTYLDDLLKIAGGINAAAGLGSDWPSIDREKLVAMQPDAIIQLMPGASPQVRKQARAYWDALGELSAVKHHKVFIHFDPWCMQPGGHVVDVAELLAADLHPPGAAAGGTP